MAWCRGVTLAFAEYDGSIALAVAELSGSIAGTAALGGGREMGGGEVWSES